MDTGKSIKTLYSFSKSTVFELLSEQISSKMRSDLQILLYGECDLKDIPVPDGFHVFRDLWNRPEEEVLKKQKSEICYLIKKNYFTKNESLQNLYPWYSCCLPENGPLILFFLNEEFFYTEFWCVKQPKLQRKKPTMLSLSSL